MPTYRINDAWTEACLLRTEELLAEARVLADRRRLLRGSRPPRRRARVMLGSVLLAAGQRLLDSAPAGRPGAEQPP
jgi:hypothetical protein